VYFLGYKNGEFGVRLWDSIEKKLVRSRDVVFFEQKIIENVQNLDMVKISSKNFVDLTAILTNTLNTKINQPSSSHLTEPNDQQDKENEPKLQSLQMRLLKCKN
jgi:hypothetical protein